MSSLALFVDLMNALYYLLTSLRSRGVFPAAMASWSSARRPRLRHDQEREDGHRYRARGLVYETRMARCRIVLPLPRAVH